MNKQYLQEGITLIEVVIYSALMGICLSVSIPTVINMYTSIGKQYLSLEHILDDITELRINFVHTRINN